MGDATLERSEQGGVVVLAGLGHWTIAQAAHLDELLRAVTLPQPRAPLRVDLSRLEAIDTACALVLIKTLNRLQREGHAVEVVGLHERYHGLLEQVADHLRKPGLPHQRSNPFADFLAALGNATLDFIIEAGRFIAFTGVVAQTLFYDLTHPRRLRLTSLVYHMEQVGVNAMPIVGLLSFLIGIVMAYQGAEQLRQFGAEIFVVDLIAISVLRELGTVLTAIVVAGRSGSAFTSQLGSMKLREEIDAMRTLGIDPIEALVLPRLLALLIALPLLGFFANMMGLFGGGLMAFLVLDISPSLFAERLSAVPYKHYLVGMIKAPFFAMLIAVVGCHQGFQVSGSAESVGQRTTRSVVESIFLVIICDAFFSIFFSLIKW